MAELVDAPASGAGIRKGVEVRVFSWAPDTYEKAGHCPAFSYPFDVHFMPLISIVFYYENTFFITRGDEKGIFRSWVFGYKLSPLPSSCAIRKLSYASWSV